MFEVFGFLTLPLAIIAITFLVQWIRVLSEYERGVIFRLGRVVSQPAGPGLVLLLAPPIIDRLVKIDLRTVTLDVPPQDVISKDNVSVKVSAVVYYKVIDPVKAVLEIENYHYATSQMAQTTLRSIIGQFELDDLLSNRETISHQIQAILDEQTEPWGIKVPNVEIKQIDLPHELQRAMARQAEAERERRAKVIAAEGEFQASAKLVQAAELMSKEPISMQMRYLQTAVEIGAEKNTTIFFPLPIDLFDAFLNKKQDN
ncbi:MAG: slipin family protein [Vampirovibrionales bacterium]|nr:slipin family protein [Vampirovibrionales bacterium]